MKFFCDSFSRGKKNKLFHHAGCPRDADRADDDPECVQQSISLIFFEQGAPGQTYGVNGVKNPNEQKWTLRPKPTHERKTRDPHDDAGHFDGLQITEDKIIY